MNAKCWEYRGREQEAVGTYQAPLPQPRIIFSRSLSLTLLHLSPFSPTGAKFRYMARSSIKTGIAQELGTCRITTQIVRLI